MSQIKIIIAQRNPWSRTKKNTIRARKYFHEFGLSDNYEITSHLYPAFCSVCSCSLSVRGPSERESKAPGQNCLRSWVVSEHSFIFKSTLDTKVGLTDNLFVPIYLPVYLPLSFAFFCCFLAAVVTRPGHKNLDKRFSVGPIVLVKTRGWFIKTENTEKTNVQIKDKTHKETY